MNRGIANCCALLVVAGLVALQNAAALELPRDSSPSVSLISDIRYLVTSESLSASQVWASESHFLPFHTPYIDIGRTRDTVWLRTQLTNPEPAARVARLDTGRQYIEWMQIYLIREDTLNQPELIYEATSEDPFAKRPIDELVLVADIEFAAEESVGVLIAFRSVDTTWIPLRIGAIEAIDDEHTATITIDWLINGALLAMVLFALLMGPVIGWPLSCAFAAYILTATAYVAHADGYTFRYLWPDMPGWHDAARLIFISLMPVAALNFAQRLFDFSEFRWLTRTMWGLMAAATCAALGAHWVVQVPWLMTIAYLLVPICTLVQVLAGVIALRSSQLGAVPYLVGAVFVCSSFIYAAIAHLQPGVWDVDFTLDYGHLALFGETISFGLAIALRLRGLRREATAAQSLAADRKQQLDALNHDIRQPLLALREGIAKLEGGDLQNQMTTAFRYLESLAQHGPVVDVVEDQESYPAALMLNGIRDMFEDEAGSRGVRLDVATVDAALRCDPIALMRIVSNLVANAIEHGGDLVSVDVRSTAPLIISVQDNGAGMDSDTLQRRMRKGDSGTGEQGRGLGLDIVQSMADSIGAVFRIESIPGEGTLALIELPGHS